MSTFGRLSFIALAPLVALAGGCEPPPEQEIEVREGELFVQTKLLWESPTIQVCWEQDGYAQERAWVQNALRRTWEAHSNVRFVGWGRCYGGRNGANRDVLFPGIRVMFENQRWGYAQALGKGLRGWNGAWQAFISIPLFNGYGCGHNEFCIGAVAVHEFGHGLGFAHEQNRDDTPAWCNMRQGSNGNAKDGTWDPDSVMNYCNVVWNNNGNLSAGDIAGVRRFYGP